MNKQPPPDYAFRQVAFDAFKNGGVSRNLPQQMRAWRLQVALHMAGETFVRPAMISQSQLDQAMQPFSTYTKKLEHPAYVKDYGTGAHYRFTNLSGIKMRANSTTTSAKDSPWKTHGLDAVFNYEQPDEYGALSRHDWRKWEGDFQKVKHDEEGKKNIVKRSRADVDQILKNFKENKTRTPARLSKPNLKALAKTLNVDFRWLFDGKTTYYGLNVLPQWPWILAAIEELKQGETDTKDNSGDLGTVQP